MLKDYYYFMGILPSATPDEITQAYRKLSVKFHPDKNPNDVYFHQQFMALQEAYDCLIDANSRYLYQQKYQQNIGQHRQQLPPKIRTFTAELQPQHQTPKILLKWQTSGADLVKIHPIGLVAAFGEMLYELPQLPEQGLRLILHATNQQLQKTVLSAVEIGLPEHEINPKNEANLNETHEKSPNNYVFLGFSLLILLLLAVFLMLF